MSPYKRSRDLARIESEICYLQKELAQRSGVSWTIGGSTRSEELNARREELERERRAIKAHMHEVEETRLTGERFMTKNEYDALMKSIESLTMDDIQLAVSSMEGRMTHDGAGMSRKGIVEETKNAFDERMSEIRMAMK